MDAPGCVADNYFLDVGTVDGDGLRAAVNAECELLGMYGYIAATLTDNDAVLYQLLALLGLASETYDSAAAVDALGQCLVEDGELVLVVKPDEGEPRLVL